jgi:hypothetical protein
MGVLGCIMPRRASYPPRHSVFFSASRRISVQGLWKATREKLRNLSGIHLQRMKNINVGDGAIDCGLISIIRLNKLLVLGSFHVVQRTSRGTSSFVSNGERWKSMPGSYRVTKRGGEEGW